MLLLHKSKPKPIDWLHQRQIEDVGGGYGFGEWGGVASEWHQSVGWSYVEVWVDIGPSTECGVEQLRSVVGAWGWS